MKLIADRSICIGAGLCVLHAPEVFDQDSDGLVKLRTSAPDRADQKASSQAASLCPSGAISVLDD
jgi:ferredoxin